MSLLLEDKIADVLLAPSGIRICRGVGGVGGGKWAVGEGPLLVTEVCSCPTTPSRPPSPGETIGEVVNGDVCPRGSDRRGGRGEGFVWVMLLVAVKEGGGGGGGRK